MEKGEKNSEKGRNRVMVLLMLIGLVAVIFGTFVVIFRDSIFVDVAIHHKPVSIGKLNAEAR